MKRQDIADSPSGDVPTKGVPMPRTGYPGMDPLCDLLTEPTHVLDWVVAPTYDARAAHWASP
jgi:hypothetical protein